METFLICYRGQVRKEIEEMGTFLICCDGGNQERSHSTCSGKTLAVETLRSSLPAQRKIRNVPISARERLGDGGTTRLR
jgi:hypothetical protein